MYLNFYFFIIQTRMVSQKNLLDSSIDHKFDLINLAYMERLIWLCRVTHFCIISFLNFFYLSKYLKYSKLAETSWKNNNNIKVEFFHIKLAIYILITRQISVWSRVQWGALIGDASLWSLSTTNESGPRYSRCYSVQRRALDRSRNKSLIKITSRIM